MMLFWWPLWKILLESQLQPDLRDAEIQYIFFCLFAFKCWNNITIFPMNNVTRSELVNHMAVEKQLENIKLGLDEMAEKHITI